MKLKLKGKMGTLFAIPQVKAPVLITHGSLDEVTPFSHGRDLAKKQGRFVEILGGHHNDLLTSPLYGSALIQFLRGLN